MTNRVFAELKRRNVFRAAALYVAAVWALAQGIAQLAPVVGAPDWIARSFLVAAAIGFPLWCGFAWFYELTPQGLMRESAIDPGQSIRAHAGKRLDRWIIAALAIAVVLLLTNTFVSRRGADLPSAASEHEAVAERSIAVLPFLNMSGDKSNEYFSDGIAEELLNLLAKNPQLQVTARTSSFSFKGKDVKIPEIARQLHVAHVLEGSVRKSGGTVRISTQLVRAIDGYEMWSQSWDRQLDDIFRIQDEIAADVSRKLEVTLLGDATAKIALGGTHNPAAFDAYLRASSAYRRFGPVNLAAGGGNKEGLQTAVGAYSDAIRIDPDYALAYAGRSLAYADFARALVSGPDVAGYFDKARADADAAIRLAPDLAESHLALANFLAGTLALTDALPEYERAIALAPGNARVVKDYGAFADIVGRSEAGLSAARRLLVLDPLNAMNHFGLGVSLTFARRYGDAARSFEETRALGQDDVTVNMWLGLAYYFAGAYDNAAAACARAGGINGPWCLSMVYDKVGRRADAEAMLGKVRSIAGDQFAEGYADVYAQWGETARALDWLETAVRLRDPYLAYTKINPFFEPLRNEPRFQAIERGLKFPE